MYPDSRIHPCGHTGPGSTLCCPETEPARGLCARGPAPVPAVPGWGRAAPAPLRHQGQGLAATPGLPRGTPPAPTCGPPPLLSLPVLTPAIPRCYERSRTEERGWPPARRAPAAPPPAGREGAGWEGQDPPAAAPPSASRTRRTEIGAGAARPREPRPAEGGVKPSRAWPAMEARGCFCLHSPRARPCEHSHKLRPLFVPPARRTGEGEQNEEHTS